MNSYPLNSETKISNQNPSNNKVIPTSSKNLTIYKSNEQNISEKIPNRFISFLTSKVGIIIITLSVIVIAVVIFLGVYLTRNNDDKNDNVTEIKEEDKSKYVCKTKIPSDTL